MNCCCVFLGNLLKKFGLLFIGRLVALVERDFLSFTFLLFFGQKTFYSALLKLPAGFCILKHTYIWDIELYSSRRWRLYRTKQKAVVFMSNPQKVMHSIFPYMFDCWANPGVHLLLLKSPCTWKLLEKTHFHPTGFYWGLECSWTLKPANSMQVSNT